MPKKIRELKAMLRKAGWEQVAGGGKGSHTKWAHVKVARRVFFPEMTEVMQIVSRSETLKLRSAKPRENDDGRES